MTKYFLINLKYDNPKLFYENEGFGEDIFICEKCFRELRTNRDYHLLACDISFPEDEPIYFDVKNNIRIYKISNRAGKINNKIIKIIEKLSWFSKEEQKIELRQITEKMFDSNDYSYKRPNQDKFSLYTIFSYKRIIGYLLFSESYTLNSKNNKLFYYILSDIYIIREFRNRSLGKKLFEYFIKNENISFDSLYFNSRISDNLKKILISEKFREANLLSDNGNIFKIKL